MLRLSGQLLYGLTQQYQMSAVLAWLLDRVVSLVPFLHERAKARTAAQARLRHLRGQLVLFALQGRMYAGEFSEELIEWARGQLSDPEGLPDDPSYREVAGSLDMLLKHPKEFALAFRITTPGNQGKTMFFPSVECPPLNDAHLSSKDVGLLAALGTKLESINGARANIQAAHDKTWDNSLEPEQKAAASESINSAYLTISRQAQDGASFISQMELMRPRQRKSNSM